MTKVELLAELTANGNVGTFRRTPSWEKAFNEYNTIHKKSLRPSFFCVNKSTRFKI